MTEQKRDNSPKRESILDAAVRAFQKEGYDNTSMDRIAEIAGASKRTVYNHFSSKELLFQATIDRLMQDMRSLKQIPYDPSRSLEDQLADFAEAKLALAKNPSWLGLIKTAMPVFIRDPKLAKETMERAEAGGDALVVWLRAATADGNISVDDAEMAAKVFWSMVMGAFMWPLLFEDPLKPEAAQVLKTELVRTFLCRYAK
jgi:TetR/AcrR family transcriptional regulator of autoinduction and epiphytic fitness